MRKIRVLSLFSGCGGSDLGVLGGFRYLGRNYPYHPTEIVHASDFDKAAVETYNANFSKKAELADIRDLSFKRGCAEVLIGGFPCQSFSTVNPTKNPGRKQTQLFWEMARVLNQVKPLAFIAENVKGFFCLEGGKYFRLANNAFKSEGYETYSCVLNAADYGIPQKRQRLFIVGLKRSLKNHFTFPAPIFGPEGRTGMPHVPLSSIVQDLVPPDEKYYFSKKAVLGAKNAKPNMKRALAQDLNAPCLTITSHLAKVSINSRDPVLLVDPKKDLYRRFTPSEAAAIQSFPANFKFPVSETQAYRQIGNAIPPVLMWHIFQSLADCISHDYADHSNLRVATMLKKSA